MKRPYIICHMMASIDGRIDCDMTEQLGGNGYYEALDALNIDTTVEGRITAVKHYAEPGVFHATDITPVGKEEVYKSKLAGKWEVIADTRGTLLWPDGDTSDRLCLVSEQAPRAYLDYLRGRHISYIATGTDRIDLRRAVEILANDFGVERIGVVGGGHLNSGFLREGLIDEVSMLYGPGIDGREGFASAFDGIEPGHTRPFLLRLKSVKQLTDDCVWLRYNML